LTVRCQPPVAVLLRLLDAEGRVRIDEVSEAAAGPARPVEPVEPVEPVGAPAGAPAYGVGRG
jgi:hypothetical protein